MKRLSMLSVLLIAGLMLSARGVTEPQPGETLAKVTGVTVDENGTYMIDTLRQNGERVIYTASESMTATEEGYALQDIKDGDFILVRDTGVMTMSLPPQMPISHVRSVTEAVEKGLIDGTIAERPTMPGVTISVAGIVADDIDSAFAYSYGYLSMKSLIAQGLYPRGGYFARGIIDAAAASSPLVAASEMQTALSDFINNVFAAGLPTDYGEIIADMDAIMALEAPEPLEDRFAYSYGYFTVLNLLYGGIAISGPEFAQGTLTALYGADPLFTEEEMNSFIEAYIEKMEEDYRIWLEEKAESNLAAAEAFLEDNLGREGITVLPSGVQIEMIYDDTTESAMPEASDTVRVDYTLTLMDGTVMDQGEDVSFALGALIPGFSEAVQTMTAGDSIRAYIPPALGYGESGTPTIEPNSLLIFDITLNGIERDEEESVVRTYEHGGSTLTATIGSGKAVLEYPASVADSEAEAFFALENGRYGLGDLGVAYTLDGNGQATITYPGSISAEEAAAQLDILVDDLIAYITGN